MSLGVIREEKRPGRARAGLSVCNRRRFSRSVSPSSFSRLVFFFVPSLLSPLPRPRCDIPRLLDASSPSVCPFVFFEHCSIRGARLTPTRRHFGSEIEGNICRNHAVDPPAQNRDYYDREHLRRARIRGRRDAEDSLGEVSRGRDEEKKKNRSGGLNSLAEESRVFSDVYVARRTRPLVLLGAKWITRFVRNPRRNWHKVSFGPSLSLSLSLPFLTLSDLGKESRDNSSSASSSARCIIRELRVLTASQIAAGFYYPGFT